MQFLINSRQISHTRYFNGHLLRKPGLASSPHPRPHPPPPSGRPQSRRKNSPSFPGFSRAINLLFHRLSQQKANVIMTFIKGEPAADVLLTAVLHKYLNDELKYFVCYNFSPRLHRTPVYNNMHMHHLTGHFPLLHLASCSPTP